LRSSMSGIGHPCPPDRSESAHAPGNGLISLSGRYEAGFTDWLISKGFFEQSARVGELRDNMNSD